MATTPAKKAPARTPKSSQPDDLEFQLHVKDATIDVLLHRAFEHGAFAHAADWVEAHSMAPEVRKELLAAIERNAS